MVWPELCCFCIIVSRKGSQAYPWPETCLWCGDSLRVVHSPCVPLPALSCTQALHPIACALLYTAPPSLSLIWLTVKRPNTPLATVCPAKVLSGTGTPQSQPLGVLSSENSVLILLSHFSWGLFFTLLLLLLWYGQPLTRFCACS